MKFNDKPGTFNGPAEVRLVRILPGPIERIWDYFTDSEKRAKWFAGGSMDRHVGGKVVFAFRMKNLAPNETPPADHAQAHDPGFTKEFTITKWNPPTLLGFVFGSTGESEVTVELKPQAMDVQIVITHRVTGEDVDYLHEFASGWHIHLAVLEAVIVGKKAPPFWSTKLALEAEYLAAATEAKSR